MGLWVIVGIGLRASTMSQNDIVKSKVSYYYGQLLYLYGLGQILSLSESFDDNWKLHYQPNRTSWNERSNRVEPTGGVANMGLTMYPMLPLILPILNLNFPLNGSKDHTIQ
jgi:hypothetical protein